MSRLLIGTSGWSYDHWQGVLYPAGIPMVQRLDFYLRQFDSVELNSSYYHWPRDATFANWQQRLPPGFQLTVKAARGLSHGRRLYQPEQWIQRISSSMALLQDRRGVLLVQLPPQMACDLPRLRYFLQQLPAGLRCCIEFRHADWHHDAVFELLQQYNVAYCIMSGAQLPCVLRATASFVYVRLHGPDHHHLYGGSYAEQDLQWWAARLREWQHAGRDVYVYFNNDGGGNAVRNALRLKQIVAA